MSQNIKENTPCFDKKLGKELTIIKCSVTRNGHGKRGGFMTFIIERKNNLGYQGQISDLCRRKLINYAETFSDLSKSFYGEFAGSRGDRQSILDARKLWESRQVIGSNLKEVSLIIQRMANEMISYQPLEDRKRRVVIHALRAEGIIIEDICYIPDVAENPAIGVTMYTEKRGGRPAKEVADMLSVLLKQSFDLSITSPYLVDRNRQSYIFLGEARMMALTGFAKVVKEGEKVSGDNYSFLESERGKLTVLLSDGTGSGEKACEDSEKVLDLAENMLEAGYGIDMAINLVNASLITCGEEQNHPTLDVCDINLYDGNCSFYKVGGAASFLKRDEEVKLIKGGSLPLGIFQTVQLQKDSIALESGDYIVMMSDGVLEALVEREYEEAIVNILCDLGEQNPKMIAEKLLQMAICAGQGHIRDDMTVLVIGVWEKQKNENR